MEYQFSTAWFFMGLLIIIAGAILLRFHQWVADNLGGGIGSYDHYKLGAIAVIGFGLLAMVNLHTFLLGLVLSGLFSGLTNN